ncbi:SDR family oxidoreductase [Plesiomonas shigelloides]|uniref:SDR family oxidoreductase n=1 Tax=Plesiomonas shigelloides TaxID=703 RepID=UPI001261D95B|nr:SDR family oxidoreductase [Plesiomonas shigelloides]KAB7695097.1 SDR family oxidoreductase [Plesiomonas shigelloides]
MGYFITGATGFIGRFLLEKLAHRNGNLYCLVRSEAAAEKLQQTAANLNIAPERIHAVYGDITEPLLGLSAEQVQVLQGKITHFFHLAALYDLDAKTEVQIDANVAGTRNAIACAEKLKAGCFHHTSSIAAAGLYRGCFDETMFDQAEHLDSPYFLTKHLAERAVREECCIPWRIYRPGIVVGHSKTGEADRVNGPYFFFKFLQRIRNALPSWMPLLGIEGGRINIVPVDFVVNAMDHLAHLPDLDGQCFHLTDSRPFRTGEVLNIFSEAGHGPKMVLRFNSRLFNLIPGHLMGMLCNYPPVQRISHLLLAEYGIPASALSLINYPTRFDNRRTQKLLEPAGIRCPSLDSYAPQIWDYWERNLDPDLFIDQILHEQLHNKVVLLTGGSSGIGLATAIRLAPTGAHLLLVARKAEQLEEARAAVEQAGGRATCYICDLSDSAACDALIQRIHEEHHKVDVLINNAGRSIRRSVADSYDRFHDFERTMAINYFGALRLILGCLPKMDEQRNGHIINISSIGVLTNSPRFSAYVASKAALESFCRCAASEYSDRGVRFTTINMPLVKTPMIAPTRIYDTVPTLTPEDAANMVVDAIVHKPKRIATKLGIFGAVIHSLSPRMAEVIMNIAFRMFPDSADKGGELPDKSQQQEMIAFAAMLRGIHF